jgi:uncharacterized membrane protein YjgN (DUF898 family)
MTSLVFSVGIAVAFLTVWGVVMVGAYLLGNAVDDVSTSASGGRGVDTSAAADA